jgi:hypothetical protein
MGNCFARFDSVAISANPKDEIIRSMQVRRKAKVKMLESDQMANIELENTKLILMNIELYDKLLHAFGEYKPDPKNKSICKAKPKYYVKPKFTINDIENAYDLADSFGEKIPVRIPSDVTCQPLTPHHMRWSEITLEEFDDAFNQNLSKKDMLGIPKFLLKNLPFYLKILFVNEFNRLLNGESNVSDISIAKSSYVYKESKAGPLEKINSFRPIMAIPNIVNHLHRILTLRLNNYLLNNKLINTTIQKGGVGGMSYSLFEQIYKIKNVIKDSNLKKKSCTIVFLDIINAYGTLNLESLYGILKSYNVAEEFISYLKNYYDNLEFYSEVNSQFSKTMKWSDGLIQGCSMSSTLFVTALNMILTKINDKYRMTCGYRFSEDNPILLTAYVDDLTIIAKDEASAQVVLDELAELLGNIGLKISKEKSAVMNVQTASPEKISNSISIKSIEPIEYIIDITKLPSVKTFKYLGEYITSDGIVKDQFDTLVKEIVRKIKILDSKKITSDEKMNIFSEICAPWIQRRTLTMYNMTNKNRYKLYAIVRQYINKWSPAYVQLFADVSKIVDSSLDDVILGIKKENLDPDISGIRYPEKAINVQLEGFGYGGLDAPDFV